jgi:hypothetical protein
MRIAHEYRGQHDLHDTSLEDSVVKKMLYWVIVFLAFVSVICIGIIVVHWSITSRIW